MENEKPTWLFVDICAKRFSRRRGTVNIKRIMMMMVVEFCFLITCNFQLSSPCAGNPLKQKIQIAMFSYTYCKILESRFLKIIKKSLTTSSQWGNLGKLLCVPNFTYYIFNETQKNLLGRPNCWRRGCDNRKMLLWANLSTFLP